MEGGLKCISFIDYWPDVIEEDAFNEKCCKEVLRKLIKKADNEIEELEGDLFILESQLEWAEKNKYEEWFDICCKGIIKNIHWLELSIFSLKDVRNGDASSVQSKMCKERVRRIREIIKASLSNEVQDKHEQPANIFPKDLRSAEQPGNIISKDLRSDAQPADIISKDSRSNEQPVEILSKDLSSFEQRTDIISKDLRSDTRHLSGILDSTTTEAEKITEWKLIPYYTELSLILKMNSDLAATINVRDSGDAATIGTCSINSSPMFQEKMDENEIRQLKVDGREQEISVTEMAHCLIPSLDLQRQQKNHRIKSEIFKVQEPSTMSNKASSIRLNPSQSSETDTARKPKSTAQSDRSGIGKSSATLTDKISSASYLKLKGTVKGEEKRIQSRVDIQNLPVTLVQNSNNDTSNSNSSLMLQEQMDKNILQLGKIEAPEPWTSVTVSPISSIPSLEMQRKARIKSETFNEPNTISDQAVSIRFCPSTSSQRKRARTVKSKTESDPLHIGKSSATLIASKVSSTSSSKSRGTHKPMHNQMEGQKSYSRRASPTVSDDLSLKSFLKSQEKKKNCIIQKDEVRVKKPWAASTEFLKLGECMTKDDISNSRDTDNFHMENKGSLLTKPDDLNKLTLPQLKELGKSLGLRGCGEYRKAELIELIAEMLIAPSDLNVIPR